MNPALRGTLFALAGAVGAGALGIVLAEGEHLYDLEDSAELRLKGATTQDLKAASEAYDGLEVVKEPAEVRDPHTRGTAHVSVAALTGFEESVRDQVAQVMCPGKAPTCLASYLPTSPICDALGEVIGKQMAFTAAAVQVDLLQKMLPIENGAIHIAVDRASKTKRSERRAEFAKSGFIECPDKEAPNERP